MALEADAAFPNTSTHPPCYTPTGQPSPLSFGMVAEGGDHEDACAPLF